jgi:hypothetical protein
MDTITIKDTTYNLAFLASMKFLPGTRERKQRVDLGSGIAEQVATGEMESTSSLTLIFVGVASAVHAHGEDADDLYEQLAKLMDLEAQSAPTESP